MIAIKILSFHYHQLGRNKKIYAKVNFNCHMIINFQREKINKIDTEAVYKMKFR